MSLVVDSTVISLISAIVAVAGLIITYFKFVVQQNDRLTKLETKMDLIWHYIDDNMGKILHSPHTPVIDALIEKMPNVTLFEAEELKCLLIPDWKNETDPQRRKVYGLYLARIDSLILDKQTEKKK